MDKDISPETTCTVQSSQESEIFSQETFNDLWKSISESTLNNLAENFLDSSNINNDDPQQHLLADETRLPGELQAGVQLPTQSNLIQSSSLPACETWSGDYNFSVTFSPQHKSTKGVAWTYSPIKDKLYVGKDAPCPVNFSVNAMLSDHVCIRVMALYTSPEQVSEIVTRCVNHSMDEIKNGRVEAEHLIRCESAAAEYHIDAAGRHSVVVPFENPPAGQKYSTYIYKFACFGSCAGGPNRRPLMLIFTLEAGGQVIGRRKLDVKICACPGRDRKTEEAQCFPAEAVNPPTPSPLKRKNQAECKALYEVMEFTKSIYAPLPKKKKSNRSRDGFFYLRTEDEECHDFLQQMKKFFDMCKAIRNQQPDVANMAMQHLQKVKTERKPETEED